MEQFKRLGRWLERIEKQDVPQVTHIDYMWAFFQNCYAMREWVHKDYSLPKEVRRYIHYRMKKSPNIMICHELGNKSKHLKPKGERECTKVDKVDVNIMAGYTVFPFPQSPPYKLTPGLQIVRSREERSIIIRL